MQAFQGSVIAVSHDRYFLRRIATRILQVWCPVDVFDGKMLAVTPLVTGLCGNVLVNAPPQVENCKLRDYKGDYEYFLEQNEDEAAKMEAKEEKAKEIAQDSIKAKSKMTKV